MYQKAIKYKNECNYFEAIKLFEEIKDYQDSKRLLEECQHYFYYSTDYDSQPWKRLRKFRGIFLKLFFRINPQRLHIEIYDAE